jgi:hypothetical protein
MSPLDWCGPLGLGFAAGMTGGLVGGGVLRSCTAANEGHHQDHERRRHGALRDALLEGCPRHHAGDRRDADQDALPEVHVPVQRRRRGGQRADHDDRHQRRARRLALLVAEPEHEQRDDDRAAADAEEPAERRSRWR